MEERHLSDLQAPEIDRRADIDRAEVGCFQHELAPRHVAREYGRNLEPRVVSPLLLRVADIHADERVNPLDHLHRLTMEIPVNDVEHLAGMLLPHRVRFVDGMRPLRDLPAQH